MSNLAEKLSSLREAAGISQQEFAAAMNVTERTQRNYESGKSVPNADYIRALAMNGFDIVNLLVGSENYLTPLQVASSLVLRTSVLDRAKTEDADTVQVPLYDVQLSAGHGAALQDEQVIDTYTYKRDFIKQIGCDPNHLGLSFVRGDSMEPTLFHGDMALYDTRVQWFIDEGIYVVRYDDRLMVKRLERLLDGSIKIISDNERYDPIIVTESTQHGFGVLGYLVDFSRSNKTCYRPSA